ncbi:MAG: alpha/beta fold hydrolase [Pseudomonadota bacterium]
MTEEFDKSVSTSFGKLTGSLRLPANKIRYSALILAGSGALDRNGNGLGLQLNLYNSLAQQLADIGIASFRYDKRGCGDSDGVHLHAGFFDLLDDATCALQAMQKFEELHNTPVMLIGHSEGTLLSSSLATSHDCVQQQVLIAPFLDPLEQLIEAQITQTVQQIQQLRGIKGVVSRLMLWISGDQIKKQRRIMDKIRHSREPTITIKKNPINAQWLRDHQSINPRDIHQRCKTPTLSIGCEKDLQCPASDAQSIARVIQAPAETYVVPNLTHILRTDTEAPSTFRYRELSTKPVDDCVVQLIDDWLQQQSLAQ